MLQVQRDVEMAGIEREGRHDFLLDILLDEAAVHLGRVPVGFLASALHDRRGGFVRRAPTGGDHASQAGILRLGSRVNGGGEDAPCSGSAQEDKGDGDQATDHEKIV